MVPLRAAKQATTLLILAAALYVIFYLAFTQGENDWSTVVAGSERRRKFVPRQIHIGGRYKARGDAASSRNELDLWLSGRKNLSQYIDQSMLDCDVSLLHRKKMTLADVERVRSCQHLFYNRVPKCGSRTVLTTFKYLGLQLNYTVIGADRPSGRNYFANATQFKNFLKKYTSYKEPFLYSQHLHFVNFTRIRLPKPAYINVIREPLDRFLSHYFYNMYGSNSAPKNSSSRHLTLDACVISKKKQCMAWTYMNAVIPFFCGHEKKCRKTSEATLQRAKRTVEKSYLLVGLQDDLPGTMEALERLMPRFFRNASTTFAGIEANLRKLYRTVKRREISEEATSILKYHLRYEYDFYAFVKKRFYDLLNRLRSMDS